MKADRPIPTASRRASTLKAILGESIVVALMGAVLAFALNAASPRGLTLTRDYFPGAVRPSLPGLANTNLLLATAATNAEVAAQLVIARLKAKQLQLVNREQTQLLFQDPRYDHGAIAFVDARDDQHYQAGHIPGAYQFDHYRAPDYLAAILPVCTAAEQIVVYCNGGDCEDSEFAAVMLRELGVPNEKLVIYGGGFTDWSTNGLPVELGARGSGNLRRETK